MTPGTGTASRSAPYTAASEVVTPVGSASGDGDGASATPYTRTSEQQDATPYTGGSSQQSGTPYTGVTASDTEGDGTPVRAALFKLPMDLRLLRSMHGFHAP